MVTLCALEDTALLATDTVGLWVDELAELLLLGACALEEDTAFSEVWVGNSSVFSNDDENLVGRELDCVETVCPMEPGVEEVAPELIPVENGSE